MGAAEAGAVADVVEVTIGLCRPNLFPAFTFTRTMVC